jgi:hypothetical protein
MARLSAYSFGRVKIDDQTMTRDLILLGEEVLSPWIRKEGHRLYVDDLKWVLDRHPDVVIVGTGAFGGLRVPQETVDLLNEKGIELQALNTEKAVEVYNHCVEQGDRAACCLHLTC